MYNHARQNYSCFFKTMQQWHCSPWPLADSVSEWNKAGWLKTEALQTSPVCCASVFSGDNEARRSPLTLRDFEVVRVKCLVVGGGNVWNLCALLVVSLHATRHKNETVNPSLLIVMCGLSHCLNRSRFIKLVKCAPGLWRFTEKKIKCTSNSDVWKLHFNGTFKSQWRALSENKVTHGWN